VTFPRYSSSGTPFNELVESQAGNATTANSAIYRLIGMINGKVIDRDLNTAPGSPGNLDLYIVGPSPTGIWAGKAGKFALNVTGTGWLYGDPDTGMVIYVVDEKLPMMYSAVESLWFPLQDSWQATEHWTGRYFSGAKVYAKTITFGTLVAGNNPVAHGITGLDLTKPVYCQGVSNLAGFAHMSLGGVFVDWNGQGIGIIVDSTLIFIDVLGTIYPSQTAWVRMTYCKV
jgi:hypothetical protein